MSRLLAKLFPKRFNARSSLTELAAEIWAIDERLEPMLEEVTQSVLKADVVELAKAEIEHDCDCEDDEDCDCREYMKVVDGVAHIPVDGLLVSRGAQLFRAFGVAATGYNEINAALDEARSREDVKEVRLHVNSPGGSVTGLQSTASRIFALSRHKAVSAHASGMVASAAYWLASQVGPGNFTAEEGTEVGSIGVYATVADTSRMFEDQGIKVHILRSGEHKGVGEPGVAITDRQLNKMQRAVNRSANEFVAAVARGRDLKQSDVERLATGETWSAADALDHMLIDGIESADGALILKNQAPGGAQEEDRMSNKDAADQAVKLEELLAKVQKDFDMKLETRLKEERAQYEARLAEANASIVGLKEDQKKKLIDRAAAEGRIVPAQRDAIESFAKVATVEQLDAFLASQPKQTSPDMVGSSGGLASKRHRYVSDGETHLATLLGLEAKDIDGEFANAVGVTTDGKLIRQDGSIVDAKALLRGGAN